MRKILSAFSDLLLILGCVLIGWACFEIHEIAGLLYCGSMAILTSAVLAKLINTKEANNDP